MAIERYFDEDFKEYVQTSPGLQSLVAMWYESNDPTHKDQIIESIRLILAEVRGWRGLEL